MRGGGASTTLCSREHARLQTNNSTGAGVVQDRGLTSGHWPTTAVIRGSSSLSRPKSCVAMQSAASMSRASVSGSNAPASSWSESTVCSGGVCILDGPGGF